MPHAVDQVDRRSHRHRRYAAYASLYHPGPPVMFNILEAPASIATSRIPRLLGAFPHWGQHHSTSAALYVIQVLQVGHGGDDVVHTRRTPGKWSRNTSDGPALDRIVSPGFGGQRSISSANMISLVFMHHLLSDRIRESLSRYIDTVAASVKTRHGRQSMQDCRPCRGSPYARCRSSRPSKPSPPQIRRVRQLVPSRATRAIQYSRSARVDRDLAHPSPAWRVPTMGTTPFDVVGAVPHPGVASRAWWLRRRPYSPESVEPQHQRWGGRSGQYRITRVRGPTVGQLFQHDLSRVHASSCPIESGSHPLDISIPRRLRRRISAKS